MLIDFAPLEMSLMFSSQDSVLHQEASASFLQRHFIIPYNRACRILKQLEMDGVVGPQIGEKPREVLIKE